MATPSTTHGAFSWNELTTSDPKPARKFYGSLLGWQFQDMDTGDRYPDGRPLRDDHGSAGRDLVAHHLREEELGMP